MQIPKPLKPPLPKDAPDCVPMEVFRAIMEDMHTAIGCTPGLPEPQRNLLLGRLEGHMSSHAFWEVSGSRMKAIELIYAAQRAEKLAERVDLTFEQRCEKMRETLGPYLRKPEASK